MDKPVSVLVDECKNNLVDVLNNSGLPAFLLVYIVKDLYTELNAIAEHNVKAEKEAYIQSLNESKQPKDSCTLP